MNNTHRKDDPILSYRDAPACTISAGGVNFAYRELGPKGGVPVVFFVHLAAVLDNWDPRIIDPIAARHHVIAFDNRGVGASSGEVPPSVATRWPVWRGRATSRLKEKMSILRWPSAVMNV